MPHASSSIARQGKMRFSWSGSPGGSIEGRLLGLGQRAAVWNFCGHLSAACSGLHSNVLVLSVSAPNSRGGRGLQTVALRVQINRQVSGFHLNIHGVLSLSPLLPVEPLDRLLRPASLPYRFSLVCGSSGTALSAVCSALCFLRWSAYVSPLCVPLL